MFSSSKPRRIFMATAIEAEVRSILTPEREDKIDTSYTKSWNDWWNSGDRKKLSRWSRTRANNIFEYLATHLIEAFADDSGARFIFQRETFKLILDNRLIIRFKKTGHNGMGSCIDTQENMNFEDPQMEFPGFPKVQKVEVDYVLNVTETGLAEIIVLARNGDKKTWSYGINPSSGAKVLPLIQPEPPFTPIEDLVIPRIIEKPKKSEKGEE
jgi:hypothetical protein